MKPPAGRPRWPQVRSDSGVVLRPLTHNLLQHPAAAQTTKSRELLQSLRDIGLDAM